MVSVELSSLFANLSHLIDQMCQLLETHQRYFIQNKNDFFSQGNEEILNLDHQIKDVVIQISNHSDWLMSQGSNTHDAEQKNTRIAWENILKKIAKMNDLININQRVIHSNYAYYQQIVESLTLSSQDGATYNEQAKMERV